MIPAGVLRNFFGVGQASASSLFRNVQTSLRTIGGCRTLYAAEAIGVDGYTKTRERVRMQFSGMADKFRAKMQEFSVSDSKNMIFTEDLKNMVHLVEANPDDLQLVHSMMRKFNQQNKHLRFGNFIFGPVVMRMYHHLNSPKDALAAFKDPELEGFFDQLATYQILCDLLFGNKMYNEVLEVYEIIKTNRVEMTKFPRNVMVLVFASLHQMNSVQSYELACKLLTEMKEVGVEPVRRVLSYASSLALKQNAPNVALEILSSARQANYVTIRNLKILALAELGRPDDALPLLRWSLDLESPNPDLKASVCPEVLEKVASAIEKLDNKDATAEFSRIKKALVETGQVTKESLDDMIGSEIQVTNQSNSTNMRRQNIQRSFRIGRSIDMRPKMNPIYQRERRSIQIE